MKSATHAAVIAISTLIVASAAFAGGSKYVASDSAEFMEVVPGVSKVVLWGDHEKGPYGAFTRFKPGTDNGNHIHTNDVRIVVLEGAYVYRDDSGETRVEAGDFMIVAGGKRHWSGGDAEQGALFYEASDGAFDLVPQD